MNEILEKNIENKIYEIRGVQVMLDFDLARIYKCKNGTKEINQAVNRNINKFPMEFSWILSNEESKDFLVTNCDQKIETRGGRYKNPRVFTEQGVYMLATILKSKAAVNTTIKIIETFVKMRHCIIENKDYLPNRVLLLEEKVDNNTKKINEIFDRFDRRDIKKNQILFEGEIYDAYSLLMDIFSISEEEIIIIDNYAGKELLDILKNINKNITIVSSNIDSVLKKKYESQYKNIMFINNNSFHDRFIIIDKKILYTCGSSFKDLGKKCFSINRFDDNEYLNKIIETIKI